MVLESGCQCHLFSFQDRGCQTVPCQSHAMGFGQMVNERLLCAQNGTAYDAAPFWENEMRVEFMISPQFTSWERFERVPAVLMCANI